MLQMDANLLAYRCAGIQSDTRANAKRSPQPAPEPRRPQRTHGGLRAGGHLTVTASPTRSSRAPSRFYYNTGKQVALSMPMLKAILTITPSRLPVTPLRANLSRQGPP